MGKRILVTDDSKLMRDIITYNLKKYGITDVDYASDGLEAVKKYKEAKYDFVTMDITMKEMNGIDALKEIISYDKNAKIIMVTSMGQNHLITDAVQNGAIDFIIKPFTAEKVNEIISKYKKTN